MEDVLPPPVIVILFERSCFTLISPPELISIVAFPFMDEYWPRINLPSLLTVTLVCPKVAVSEEVPATLRVPPLIVVLPV